MLASQPTWRLKHAWHYIDRELPPKRAAADRVCDFHEIQSIYDEVTVRAQASRCIQCPKPQCVTGCPLNNRIPEWVALAAEGRFLEASEISQATSNMPEICSRVCPQERLCEGACILNARSEPVSIGAIEKFINEYAFAHDAVTATRHTPNGFRVAIIGAGPGGLACADELAKLGYAVTVFEAALRLGGLLVNGIPAFKLDKRVVERRINVLRKRGVVFQTDVEVGPGISLNKLRADFDAVFLGFGAQKAKATGIPGSDLEGVIQALPFLVRKNIPGAGEYPDIPVAGRRVAVLGGGDTAMDCLRTAVRCGAQEAVCLYRRDLQNMPGSRKEYVNAVEEGARFEFLTNPVAIEGNGNGRVTGVRCVRMELGPADASGRRSPRPVPGSEFLVPADFVVAAYGFDPLLLAQCGFGEIEVNDWGAIKVDERQMTNVPGIFAGGDNVRGPSLVVHAVRDGRRAAAGIDRYLQETRARQETRAAGAEPVGR